MISSEIFTDPAKFRYTLLDFKSIEQFLETEKYSDPYRNQLTQLSIEIANYIGKPKALEIRHKFWNNSFTYTTNTTDYPMSNPAEH